MAFQLAIAFSSLLVEHEHLFALYQRGEHFANHLCAFYGGNAYGDVTVFVHQQNLVKLYCCTALDVLDVVNEQLLAGLSLELLALNFIAEQIYGVAELLGMKPNV